MSAAQLPAPVRRVALLESSVAERIAAGEVIERPSSVIKELVENSVDAGSTRIWVDIRDGGQSLIRVVDDGCGMGREDAVLALNRFATSKIRTWDDMENLQTLGFRGEAMPSIVAVSCLELLTREAASPVGTRVVARGADPVRVEEVGCAEGTTATVTELFFNTPARRKFLKSGVAEAARIVDLMGRFAMLHTHIHFRLTSGDRELFNLPVQYGLQERLKRLWHVDARGGVATLAHIEEGVRVSGVAVCPPTFANTRARQVIFVNGRLVVNPALSQAIQQGFEPLVPDRRFPMAVIFIEVPPGEVDVNVHPTKSEIRFLAPRLVFRSVRDAIANALTRAEAQPQDHVEAIRRVTNSAPPTRSPALRPSWGAPPAPTSVPTGGASASLTGQGHAAPSARFGAARPLPEEVQAAIELSMPLEIAPAAPPPPRSQALLFPEASRRPGNGTPDGGAPGTTDEATATEVSAAQLPSMPIPPPIARVASPTASRWQVLAQLHRTYIVGLRDDDLFIVDQHTAHERVNYELLAHLEEGSRQVASQPLLFPMMLELAPDEAAALAANIDIFEELGYEIEPFGGETFVVRALPAGLPALSRPPVLTQIVAEVARDDRAREPQRLRELLRATTACRASVMAGDLLTREEMETLLTRLEAVPRGGYCPHGRPVIIGLGEVELARLFGRR